MAEPAELPPEFPEAPFPLESFELVLFSRSEEPPVHDGTELKAIVAAHLAYAQEQFTAGRAVLAGAVVDHPRYNGLGLFCTGSMETTRAILQNDPVIAAGVDRYELMRFVTRRGVVQRPG